MDSSRILVVENDPAIRRGLVDALDFAGHEVRASEDGSEVVGAVKQWLPDRELLARVQAVLRRAPERPQEGGRLSLGGRVIDLSRHTVELPDGETRQLADREVASLRHLARTGERPVPRDELLRDVWVLDPRGLNTRTVDMHIARLREKLCDDGQLIVTVRGRGYALGPGVKVDRS